MIKRLLCCLFIIIYSSNYLSAQEEDTTSYFSPFTLGFGAGMYHTNHQTAEYYSGRSGGRLASVLQLQEHQIRDELGTAEFDLAEYAQDMKYNKTFYFELQLGLNFNQTWGMRVNFLNAQLDANGIFTLNVQKTNPSNSVDPYKETINIRGKEKRSHIEVGLYRNFSLPKPFIAHLELGYHMAFVETKENVFKVGNRDFSIPQTADLQNPGQDITTFGSGIYGILGGGLQLPGDYKVILQFRMVQTKIDVEKIIQDKGLILTGSLILSKRF